MRIILIIATLFALHTEANAGYRFYDRNGAYAGRVSKMGNVYNRQGSYSGRIR